MGLEPMTSCVTGKRSSLLNYIAIFVWIYHRCTRLPRPVDIAASHSLPALCGGRQLLLSRKGRLDRFSIGDQSCLSQDHLTPTNSSTKVGSHVSLIPIQPKVRFLSYQDLLALSFFKVVANQNQPVCKLHISFNYSAVECDIKLFCGYSTDYFLHSRCRCGVTISFHLLYAILLNPIGGYWYVLYFTSYYHPASIWK